MSPDPVQVWFHRLYQELGFSGASSHSGRRTFITRIPRGAYHALHEAGIEPDWVIGTSIGAPLINRIRTASLRTKVSVSGKRNFQARD
jgi:hypothetical protein